MICSAHVRRETRLSKITSRPARTQASSGKKNMAKDLNQLPAIKGSWGEFNDQRPDRGPQGGFHSGKLRLGNSPSQSSKPKFQRHPGEKPDSVTDSLETYGSAKPASNPKTDSDRDVGIKDRNI